MFGYLKIILLLGIIPYFVGMSIVCIFKLMNRKCKKIEFNKFMIALAYNLGYFFYMIFFQIIASVSLRQTHSLKNIEANWIGANVILIIASTLFLLYTLSRHKFSLKDASVDKNDIVKILLIFTFIVLSVMFTTPSVYDEIPYEVVLTEAKSRALYCSEINNLGIYTADAKSFLYLFYVITGKVASVKGLTVCMFWTPFFLYSIFFSTYSIVAHIVFPESKKNRAFFLGVVYLGYFVQLFTNSYVGLAAFQNIWNGKTLLVSCYMPLFFALIAKISLKIKNCRNMGTNE